MSELIKSPDKIAISTDSPEPNEISKKEGVISDSVDPVYARKAQILNDAIQDIGMGWYQ